MEHKPALYALIRLHAEIGGKLKDNKLQAEKLVTDMKHVEAVLKLLEPGYNVRSIASKRKRNPNPLYKRGTIFRAALGVLRETGKPLTADEISVGLYRAKGIENPTRDQLRHMWGAVSASMRNNEGKSVAGDDGRPRRWRLSEVVGRP